MAHIAELGAVPFTEIPQLLVPEIGKPIQQGELEKSLEGLAPRTMLTTALLDLSRPQDRPWRPDVDEAVGAALTSLAHFCEGEVARTDHAVLWKQAASKIGDDREKNRGLGYFTDRITALGGACEDAHMVRDDTTEEGTGTKVIAARIGERDCFLIESTVLTGIGNATHRQLEIFAASHPHLMAAVNAYAYHERQQVRRLLEHFDTTPEIRADVLSIANRQTAPDARAVELLFEQVTDHHVQEAIERTAAEVEATQPLFVGVAATGQHAKVLI